MKVCGPKLSLCGLIISVWGIIQLVSWDNPIYTDLIQPSFARLSRQQYSYFCCNLSAGADGNILLRQECCLIRRFSHRPPRCTNRWGVLYGSREKLHSGLYLIFFKWFLIVSKIMLFWTECLQLLDSGLLVLVYPPVLWTSVLHE